ncbi:MAG: AI-2E family transporter [Erysipelotrichaceae bacterium]
MNFKSSQMKQGMLLITFFIGMLWIGQHVELIISSLSKGIRIITPFLVGFSFAFLMNAPMMRIESFLFKAKSPLLVVPKKFRRIISYLLTLILVIVIIGFIFQIIIPELTKTIVAFINTLPSAFDDLQAWAITHLGPNTPVGDFLVSVNFDWNKFSAAVISFVNNSWQAWLNSSLGMLQSIMNAFFAFILSFMFSAYALLNKEAILSQIRRLTLAIFPDNASKWIFRIFVMADDVFSRFVFGQVIEAFIVGISFFIGLTLFRFPYALLISVIISVTSLVPILGAIVSQTIGVLLIMTVSPIQAIWFWVFYQVLQQFEGSFMYPMVVGKSVGLPAIWILVAVTIGVNLMGVVGILISIPIASLCYTLLREWVNFRLDKKKALQMIESHPE